MIRIILADDHPIIRQGIRTFLEKTDDLKVIGEAENGQQVLELVSALHPDVLVLDLKLPDINGVELVERLKSTGVQVNILVLSAYCEWETVGRCLNAGVSGYLTKNEPVDVIIEAVRGVAAGEKAWLSRGVKSTLVTIYQQEKKPRRRRISQREAEVCARITEGKTNKQIATELNLSEKTVEKYIFSLFHKLEVNSRVELAVKQTRENFW